MTTWILMLNCSLTLSCLQHTAEMPPYLTTAVSAYCSSPLRLTDPITEIKKLEVEKAAFDRKRGAENPILIKDEKTAKKYFADDQLKKLLEQVDFAEQHVLLFAWAGSGRDKLTFDVAESYPEQIQFKLARGMTRDLRQHVRVFAIRSNVKWTTKLVR